MSNPVTENQLSFIKSLATAKAPAVGLTDVDAFIETLRRERLTSTGASQLIDHLRTVKVAVAAPAPGTSAPVSDRRSNAYAGKCKNCGVSVPAGAGYLGGSRGAWTTEHKPGECPSAAAPVDDNVVLTVEDILAGNLRNTAAFDFVTDLLQDVQPGGFAVPSFSENTDVTFFRVKVNKGTINPSKKGQHYFALVVGGHGDGEIKVTPSYILKCLEAIELSAYTDEETGISYTGREAAERMFGNEIGICGRCGVALTSEWRKRGIGPVCVGL